MSRTGKQGTYNYGLPEKDPRTLLPLINVPADYTQNFGYLNMAVVHWFGLVKKLGTGFSVEERIAVLGDRCLYLCKKNADITRCIMVSDIKKLLLAQDDAKDLYVAIIMPEVIESQGDKTQRSEYDVMYHCDNIQLFVKYLRTVYAYQTAGETLPLDQVRDKDQLEREVRLTRPKNWVLTYWQPMFKEHLAKLLEAWNQKQREGGAGGGAAALGGAGAAGGAPALGYSGGGGGGGASAALGGPAAAAGAGAATAGAAGGGGSSGPDIHNIEESPLGKFLVMLGLSRYFQVMKQNSMELELMVSGLVDESDLEHFGVESATDRAAIIEGLQDKDLVDRLTKGRASASGLGYQPPKQQTQTQQYGGLQPNLAGDDDDFDLDLDAPAGGGGNTGFGSPTKGAGGGGGADLDFDLDLDDFGPMAAPAAGGPTAGDLDDFDLDLDGPSGGDIVCALSLSLFFVLSSCVLTLNPL